MQSFIIPHPSRRVFYLPVVVMGLAAAFLFPLLLLVGAKDREWLRVTKPGGCSFDSRGLLAFHKLALCMCTCTAVL